MDTPSSSDPLHEFVDIEISVPASSNAAREAELSSLLQKFPGIKSISITHGKVALTYEPVVVTQEELIGAIRSAGFQIGEITTSTSSPVSDALERIVIERAAGRDEQRSSGAEAGAEHER